MELKTFLQLCEEKLAACNDPSNAPFGMIGEQAQTYMQGRANVLQWVLEMLKQTN